MLRWYPLPLLLLWVVGIFTAGPLAQVQAQMSCPTDRWHPPGCGHEHGDPPDPIVDQFLRDHPELWPYWGNGVVFDGPWNTSAIENTTKHAGMKIYRLGAPRFTDTLGQPVSITLVTHMLSNAMDHGSQKHSMQVFVLDAAGGLTVRQGWANFGDTTTARVPKRCTLGIAKGGPDCSQYNPNQRPIMLVVDQASWDGDPAVGRIPIREETWYGSGAGFSISVGINNTTVAQLGEKAGDADPHLWHATGAGGQLREVELLARAPVYGGVRFSGAFWTNQDGDICGGPDDPDCSTNGHRALLQYISPTYNGVKVQGGGFVVKEYPLPPGGVELPN